MAETVTYSTLVLTLLLMVGLFFFIKASTKDRTETLTLDSKIPTPSTLQALTTYFEGRAYQVRRIDADQAIITLYGQVRPSWFLAGFLTLLAAVGCLCFALVLASLFPNTGLIWLGLTALSPLAGWFYWQRAGREEQVQVQVCPPDPAHGSESEAVVITAHRDELIALQQAWANGLALAVPVKGTP